MGIMQLAGNCLQHRQNRICGTELNIFTNGLMLNPFNQILAGSTC
jgi:hypothetical protein